MNEVRTDLPPAGKIVVFFWKSNGLERVSVGFYAPKHDVEALDYDADDCVDLDENEIAYFHQGWYESGWEIETIASITEPVIGWQDLPEFPSDNHQWIDWSGGECPVEEFSKVEYVLRDGDLETGMAWDLVWKHDVIGISSSYEIVKYRVVE
ncbi:hypothetical protein N9043_00810 [bacterium]|nr:hypothetical protein [bacterium]